MPFTFYLTSIEFIAVSLFLLKVFYERIGCFYVESQWILENQDLPSKIVMACSSVAWSLGLKVFAVRNGSECLGGKDFFSLLLQLKTSKGCRAGRGGQNVSDVYRLTSKKCVDFCNLRNIDQLLFFFYIN